MTAFDEAVLGTVQEILPAEAFAAFSDAANSASLDGFDHNHCVRAGWAVVKQDWEKPAAGKKWVRKENPDGGDVHVPAPMNGSGDKKPKKKPPTKVDPDEAAKSFASVCKVSDELGLVFGWAIVSTIEGQPYYDTQGDFIPEDSMMKAAADFMENSRVAKDMHAGDPVGSVVFAFPMTAEVAKALGIETQKTGLLIAMKPPADILEKFRSGEYSGFSIGGFRIEDEEAPE